MSGLKNSFAPTAGLSLMPFGNNVGTCIGHWQFQKVPALLQIQKIICNSQKAPCGQSDRRKKTLPKRQRFS
ncbi:hypothetical protein [Janthinobacterium sp. 17J80-10]|uniref:hypothetical protein n=1 Tax=Janthinobacterium sp. 17J80-10 TaxID=2497863 RepID=UPI001005769E|nr:hypothetical protein [Janthinobacterium sp. 17J80-10]QAU34832.1 hypothetical protein EKL02_11910 [Janthinobacterium sp. 17J80-10]